MDVKDYEKRLCMRERGALLFLWNASFVGEISHAKVTNGVGWPGLSSLPLSRKAGVCYMNSLQLLRLLPVVGSDRVQVCTIS